MFSILLDPMTGQVTVHNGRLEAILDTATRLNARSLRDTATGRIYADRDYVWNLPGAEGAQTEGQPVIERHPDGSLTVACTGRLGSLVVRQVFAISPDDPDALRETITIRNPTAQPLATTGFACGFAKAVRDGGSPVPDAGGLLACPIPYRVETDGRLREEPLPSFARTAAAEGWVLGDATSSLVVGKYQPDHIEWSLLVGLQHGHERQVRFAGTGPWSSATALEGAYGRERSEARFGELRQWSADTPDGAALLAPGASFRFGESRLQVVTGDWQQAYYAYRRHLESLGCRPRPGYDPPVHWNELYDNWYYHAHARILDPQRKDTRELRDFLAQGLPPLQRLLYSHALMRQEAVKARELGCEALYLDPGWDTGPSHQVWDAARLGRTEAFVAEMQRDFGLKTSIWIGLGNGGGAFADPFVLPQEARLLAADGSYDLTLCLTSPAFRAEKKRLLIELGRQGVSFMMFDSTTWTGQCHDPRHGHAVPSTQEEHVEALFDILSAVKQACPHVLIELHDPLSGPTSAHLTPSYLLYTRAHAHDCLWGHEFMWNSWDDLLSGRAKSLYYYNLAYSIPLYLHINLSKDNEQAMMFWWYASTCRHLGVGGKSRPEVWEAQKRAMRLYRAHKRFFVQGRFHGLEESIHAHTLPGQGESVLNVFNLGNAPTTRTLSIRLKDIGLAGADARSTVDLDVPIPALGHRLLLVRAAPGQAPGVVRLDAVTDEGVPIPG